MANEIEVKYRVLDVEALEAVLDRRGVELSTPVRQVDQAYAPRGWVEGDERIGVTFARLRCQEGRWIFTTKTPVDNALACREHETLVEDHEQMHLAILAMGYRPTVRIAKVRRTARVGGRRLCVDTIDDVGTFIEVEIHVGERGTDGTERGEGSTAPAEMAQAQEALATWVNGLGAPLQRTGATYDQIVVTA